MSSVHNANGGETIEFLVVNDDLILQRKPHAVSQPDLMLASKAGPAARSNVKRRVSRVESLRNLFFSKSGNNLSGAEAKKRFLNKKRARSAEKTTEKVRNHL